MRSRPQQLSGHLSRRALGVEAELNERWLIIRASVGANQTQIVIATGIDRSTLGIMCRRLAAKGLITRRRSRQDSRAIVLQLTSEGEAVLKRAQKPPQRKLPARHVSR